MIYSQDVKFNEMDFGESSLVKLTEYVELEMSSSTEEPQDNTGSREDVVAKEARRSGRIRQRPDCCLDRTSLAKNEPTTVKEAPNSQQKVKWEEAMATEMHSLQESDVWELVEPIIK